MHMQAREMMLRRNKTGTSKQARSMCGGWFHVARCSTITSFCQDVVTTFYHFGGWCSGGCILDVGIHVVYLSCWKLDFCFGIMAIRSGERPVVGCGEGPAAEAKLSAIVLPGRWVRIHVGEIDIGCGGRGDINMFRYHSHPLGSGPMVSG
ncbi:hypothetical protein EX30DRAFT_229562 [Ascodesmis nigricans]|uniref:Uncharacterized protein n=1 Tax=Ascodesmis nigricans TaxID=341454 RepID=A0A4S2MNC5_9PEZI|nr:hypothetical protein EX30DRAFT_229562 [Ascodesmis nigricans]